MKKMQKKLKMHWKFLQTGCILYALFTYFCVLTADEKKSSGTTIRLADPATESVLAKNRERLASQEAEIKKLKTENIQKQTENAQRTAEISKLQGEIRAKNTDLNKKDAQIRTLQKEIAALKGEIRSKDADLSKKNTQIRELEKGIATLKSETRSKDADLNKKDAEIRSLQKGIADLKTEKSKLASRVSRETDSLNLEKTLLEEENRNLRVELLDTLKRCARLSDQLKRLEMSAAGVLETLNPVYAGTRETELTDAYNLAMKSGMELVAKGNAVCELILPKLAKSGVNAVDQARWRVALEDLMAQNRNFARLSVAQGKSSGERSCRILEVCLKPELVILNVGYNDGIRVNMTYKVKGSAGTVLRIVSVRPFVSAAVSEAGAIRELSAGMEVVLPDEKKKTNE